MNKTFFLIFFILVPFLYYAQETEVTYAVYSDPVHKFYLKVPKGWLPSDQKSQVVIYIIVETPANDPVHSLNVQKIPITFPGEEQPRAAIDLLAQQLLEDLSTAAQFSIYHDRYLTVNGYLLREFDVSYLYEGKSLRQVQSILYHQGHVYVLAYTADAAVFDPEIYRTAQTSFKLLDV